MTGATLPPYLLLIIIDTSSKHSHRAAGRRKVRDAVYQVADVAGPADNDDPAAAPAVVPRHPSRNLRRCRRPRLLQHSKRWRGQGNLPAASPRTGLDSQGRSLSGDPALAERPLGWTMYNLASAFIQCFEKPSREIQLVVCRKLEQPSLETGPPWWRWTVPWRNAWRRAAPQCRPPRHQHRPRCKHMTTRSPQELWPHARLTRVRLLVSVSRYSGRRTTEILYTICMFLSLWRYM